MQLKREWVIPAGVGFGLFILGTGIGYVIANRKFKTEKSKSSSDDSEREIDDDSSRSEYVQLKFEIDEAYGRFDHRVQEANYVVTRLIDGLAEMKDTSEVFLGKFTNPDEPINEDEVEMSSLKDEPSLVSVFRDGHDDWDYDVELAKRNPSEPYTIHKDEFFENEDDHRQTTLTYYKGDNILCDELNSPIYDPERIVGTLEFGKGSQDPSIVYVRNERLLADYEVLLDHGYYQIEVLGQEREDVFKTNDMKHSVRKFRME